MKSRWVSHHSTGVWHKNMRSRHDRSDRSFNCGRTHAAAPATPTAGYALPVGRVARTEIDAFVGMELIKADARNA